MEVEVEEVVEEVVVMETEAVHYNKQLFHLLWLQNLFDFQVRRNKPSGRYRRLSRHLCL
ncbi:MAG: hypothetical protein ABJP70_01710 [Erythrobacter sp.]